MNYLRRLHLFGVFSRMHVSKHPRFLYTQKGAQCKLRGVGGSAVVYVAHMHATYMDQPRPRSVILFFVFVIY